MSSLISGRRRFLSSSATAVLAALAGCTGGSDAGDGTTPSPAPGMTATTGGRGGTSGTTTDETTGMTEETARETTPTTESVTGPEDGDDLPADPKPDDGYPPEFEQAPEERAIDTSSFETKTVNGTTVPLAPVDVVYYWYARGEARFADARGQKQYATSHIYGAVLSPAPGIPYPEKKDVARNWPNGDRIVCYCGCPHHLSSLRAAQMIDNGRENVFVIDEGFWEWNKRSYPMAGSSVSRSLSATSVSGRTAARFAGETAWASHPKTGQYEATSIDSGGRYTLHLRFSDVTSDSLIRVRTPSYTVERPLGELERARISSDGDLS